MSRGSSSRFRSVPCPARYESLTASRRSSARSVWTTGVSSARRMRVPVILRGGGGSSILVFHGFQSPVSGCSAESMSEFQSCTHATRGDPKLSDHRSVTGLTSRSHGLESALRQVDLWKTVPGFCGRGRFQLRQTPPPPCGCACSSISEGCDAVESELGPRAVSLCVRDVCRMRPEGDFGRIRVERADSTVHAAQIGARRQPPEPVIEHNEMTRTRTRTGLPGMSRG